MLSLADAELICREREVPGLATVLDGDALTDALSSSVPGLTGARIEYVRYKPQTSCVAGFVLQSNGSPFRGYAKAFRRDDAARAIRVVERYRSASNPASTGADAAIHPASSHYGGAVCLSELATAVFFFPVDAGLRNVSWFANPSERARFFSRVLCNWPDLHNADTTLLRYKPERRLVACLRTGAGPRAVLKLYSSATYAGARLRARLLPSEARPQIPGLLGHSDRYRALAFEWLEGLSAAEMLQADANGRWLGKIAGQSLASLHRLPTSGINRLPVQTREARATQLMAVPKYVCDVLPRLAPRMRRLAEDVASRLPKNGSAPSLIHGDFYAHQVLLDGGHGALIDFDRSHVGDRGADLGNFQAHLDWEQIRGALDEHQMSETAAGLLDGYFATQAVITEEELALEKAASMLMLATHPFRMGRGDYPSQTSALLDRAEATFQKARRSKFYAVNKNTLSSSAQMARVSLIDAAGPVPTQSCIVEDPFGVAGDPAMEFLREATNPALAAAALRRALPDQQHVDVCGIRVIRHKPGRRCLIRYEIKVAGQPGDASPMSLIAKMRARGLDTRTFPLMVMLWNGAFGRRRIDSVCVPEPVACLPEFNGWLQALVPGTTATARLLGPEGTDLARRIIRGLHKLHDQPLVLDRHHTADDELAVLGRRLAWLAAEQPHWSGRLDRILTRCGEMSSTLAHVREKPIHRDFYPDNVLVHDEDICFLDFDLHAMGDPALDAGNFIAHLLEQDLRQTGYTARAEEVAAAVIESFCDGCDASADFSVRVYTILSLVRHLHISSQFPERKHVTANLLDYCEGELCNALRDATRSMSLRCA